MPPDAPNSAQVRSLLQECVEKDQRPTLAFPPGGKRLEVKILQVGERVLDVEIPESGFSRINPSDLFLLEDFGQPGHGIELVALHFDGRTHLRLDLPARTVPVRRTAIRVSNTVVDRLTVNLKSEEGDLEGILSDVSENGLSLVVTGANIFIPKVGATGTAWVSLANGSQVEVKVVLRRIQGPCLAFEVAETPDAKRWNGLLRRARLGHLSKELARKIA